MILNEEKVIQTIADFLSDYINNCTLKNFWIKDKMYEDITVKICERARAKCGAEVLTSWSFMDYEGTKIRYYDFARHITDSDNRDECLIVSPLTRSEGIINRSFNKHLHKADVYPLLDLYRSEACMLSRKVMQERDEEEYIDRETAKNKIITLDAPPNKHPEWYKYTKAQKALIAKMHAREKATRHKDLLSRGALYPRIRDTGYVR